MNNIVILDDIMIWTTSVGLDDVVSLNDAIVVGDIILLDGIIAMDDILWVDRIIGTGDVVGTGAGRTVPGSASGWHLPEMAITSPECPCSRYFHPEILRAPRDLPHYHSELPCDLSHALGTYPMDHCWLH